MKKTVYIDHAFIIDEFYQMLIDDLEGDGIEIENDISEYHDAGALAFAENNISRYVNSTDPKITLLYVSDAAAAYRSDTGAEKWSDILCRCMYNVFAYLMHLWYKKDNDILSAAGFIV